MSEKVGIEINLIGAEKAEQTLRNIENTTKRLGAKRTMIKMEDGSLVSVEQRIKQIQDRLAVLRSQQKMGILSKKDAREMKRLNGEMTILQRGLKNATANAKTFGQVFNGISSKVAHIGSAMQSMGNAITRLTSPFRKLTTGLVMGAGYKALNLLTSGFSGSFERADIMSTYEKSLKELDLDASKKFSVAGKEAKKAKDNLDDAVQGLPTGLDEIMAAQKVYAGATNDMVESTKTAIAANNAFLASGMGSREQRFMQKYLVAMSSGAELTTTQWESMFRIAPLVMRKVSEELGYASDEYDKFREDVEGGTLAGKEFLKAFQKVGTEGAVAKAARVMAMTWSGLASNITIATKRMGQNIIETLNDTFKEKTGRTLLATLLGWDDEGNDLEDGIKHWINDLSSSVQDWIKAHPDEIVSFFEKLKALDIKGFLKGVAEGMGDVYGLGKKFVSIMSSIFGDVDMEKFGKGLVKWNARGSLFTILGGLLKGGRHLFGGTGAFGWLLKNKFGKGGLFGKIASIFGSKKAIQTAGESAKQIPTVTQSLRSAFSSLSGLFSFAAGVLVIDATVFTTLKTVKSALKDISEISEQLQGMTWVDMATALEVSIGIGALTFIFNTIGSFFGAEGLLAIAIGAAATALGAGAFAGDMYLIKTGLEQLNETIKMLDVVGDSITNMKGLAVLNEAQVQNFRDTVASIRSIGDILNGGEKTGSVKDQGEVSLGLPKINVGDVTSMTNLSDVINKLKDIVTQFNQLGAMRVVNNPATTIESIKQACDQLQGVRPPKNLGAHTEELVTALSNIKKMVKSINKLGKKTLNTSGFTALIEELRTALQSLKDASGDLELDISVTLGDTFQNSVHNCKTAIKDAKKDIEKLKTPIRYNIPVTVTFSVTSNAWSAINKIKRDRQNVMDAKNGETIPKFNQAMGGLIYRAGGGGVPFRRRGTDTVPAMLTPGEYVHNKRAVSAFGIDFMRKVNNLDMRGAMNELMHRAGHMANVNRGTYVTNNYNNNQKVVINNNNAGAGFTFKSASRFVGAI